MSDIRSSITLVDNFSGTAKGIQAAIKATASESEKLKKVMSGAPDMSGYSAVQKELDAIAGSERQAQQAAQGYSNSQAAMAASAHVTADALEKQTDKLRMSAQAAQAKADAEAKAVTVYEQEYRAYEKNANELGVLTEAQKKSIDRYREAYEQKKKAAEQAQNLADKLKVEADMSEKAAQSARKEASAYGELGTQAQKAGGSLGGMADSMSNLLMAAGGYKIMQFVKSAFTETTQAAIEFESAITGVYKTVDGTQEQLQGLSDEVRAMALSMPSSVTEIAGVMEAAGQLGIATEDVASFSKTMIDLGNSTNLSADQAASALAKFANITGMAAENYGNLGSVIVDLGNNFATTESDIVNMSTYLTSAASVAGFAETDILALAAAMSSVGINAEAGGSSMSKLISTLQTAVEVGGDGLQAFADVAGMTAQQFSDEWGTNAVGALQAFIGGLNDVERNGKSMSVILQDLDLDDIRMSNMLKALAQGNEVLTSAVQTANDAWQENVALTNEADKRYATLESKMQLMDNAANDLKISVGNALTPALSIATDTATGLMKELSGMAQACPSLTAGISGATGALGLAVGGFTTLAPAITAASTAMQAFNISTKALGIGLGVVGGIAALAGVTMALTTAFSNASDEVEDYNGTLEQCKGEIESTKAAHEKAIEMYGAESDAARELENQLDTLNAQYEKGGGAAADYAQRAEAASKSIAEFEKNYKDRFTDIEDTAASGMVMAAQFEALAEKATKTNGDLDLMSQYANYLNNTFECDIKVNYDTGEVTGFDPNGIGEVIAKQSDEAYKQKALESIAGGDISTDYRKQLTDRYAQENELKRHFSAMDAILDSYGEDFRKKYASKYGFEGYDYAQIYKDFADQGSSSASGGGVAALLNKENNYPGMDKFRSMFAKYKDDVSAYESTVDNVLQAENDIKQAFRDAGLSDQAEGYLRTTERIVTDTQQVTTQAINSVSDYEYYYGKAAEEMTDDSQAITDGLQAVAQELGLTAEKYDEVYQAAYESFSKQYDLFDNATESYKKTVEEIEKGNTSVIQSYIDSNNAQAEYFNDLNESIQTLSATSSAEIGVSRQEWDEFLDYAEQLPVTSGEKGAAIVNAFAEAINSGDTSTVKEAVRSWQENEKVMRDTSKGIGEEVADVEQAMDKARKSVEDSLKAIGNDASTAYNAAKSVVDNLASGVNSAYGNLSTQVSAIEALMSRLSNFNVSVNVNKKGKVELPEEVPQLASGTRSAMPGLTLVGEEGPELVTFSGGESVYPADKTRKILERMQQGLGNTSIYIPTSVQEAASIMPNAEHFGSFAPTEAYNIIIPEKDDDESLKLSTDIIDYIRDRAEREAINRTISNEVKIEMKDVTINSEADADGIIDYLARGIQEALETSAVSVHD